MLWGFRGFIAWLLAAAVFVGVVVFELALWLVLAALLTAGLCYELTVGLMRRARGTAEKPIEPEYVKRRRG